MLHFTLEARFSSLVKINFLLCGALFSFLISSRAFSRMIHAPRNPVRDKAIFSRLNVRTLNAEF